MHINNLKYQGVKEFHMPAGIGCYCAPYVPPMHPLHAPNAPLRAPYASPTHPMCPWHVSDWLMVPITANQITGIDQPHLHKILIFFPTTS